MLIASRFVCQAALTRPWHRRWELIGGLHVGNGLFCSMRHLMRHLIPVLLPGVIGAQWQPPCKRLQMFRLAALLATAGLHNTRAAWQDSLWRLVVLVVSQPRLLHGRRSLTLLYVLQIYSIPSRSTTQESDAMAFEITTSTTGKSSASSDCPLSHTLSLLPSTATTIVQPRLQPAVKVSQRQFCHDTQNVNNLAVATCLRCRLPAHWPEQGDQTRPREV